MKITPSAQVEPAVLAVRAGEWRVALDLAVPPDLLYCRGHFPRHAILPGVVQIHWAIIFGRRYLPLHPSSPTVLQVKFRRAIRPGERLTLDLRFAPERNRLFFDYRVPGEVSSTGHVLFEP
jgi:3-hydroxymyristoyl/3-hydroxydecanoyl-(acyl carrier protein) dehydratase